MADVAIRIVGDPSSGSAAIDDVAIRAQRAMDKAAQISARMDQVDKQRSAEKTAIANATTAAETTAAQRRFDTQERLYQRLAQAKETADQRVVDSERRMTRAVEQEAKKQGDARMHALKQAGAVGAAVVGSIGGGPIVGAAAGLLVGANPAVAAAVAATEAIKASIGALTGAVAQARELALVLGSTNEQASLLVGIGQRLGVSSEAMALGLKSAAVATENSPELFQALGVALKDAEGNARPLNDVITETRDRMSKAGNDTKFMAWATALFGRGAIDLLPWLKANSDQVKTLGDETARSGDIIDKDMVAASTSWTRTIQILNTTLQNMGQNFATFVVPLMVKGAGLIGESFDWIGTALDGLNTLSKGPAAKPGQAPAGARPWWDMTGKTPWSDAGRAELEDMLGGPVQFPGEADPRSGGRRADNEEDQLRRQQLEERRGAMAPTGPWEVIDQARRGAAERRGANDKLLQDLINQATGGGKTGGEALPSIPGAPKAGRDTFSDAIREHIDVIREASSTNLDRLRSDLEADQKRKQSTLDITETLRKSTASVYAAEVDRIQRIEAAADKATKKRIDGINAELDARQAARDADEAALRAQLAALDAVDQAGEDAAALGAAQDALETERTKNMTRLRSEAPAAFATRVKEHNEEIARLEEALAKVQADQAKAASRAAIQAKLDQVNRTGELDRKSTQDAIANIQKQRETAREAAEYQIDLVQTEAKERDRLFERALAGVKALKDAAKEKADAEIAESRRSTDAIISDLQKQMAARQPGAGAGASVTSGVPMTLKYQVPNGPNGSMTNTVMSGELAQARSCEADGRHQWNWSDHTCFLKPTAAVGGSGGGGGPANAVMLPAAPAQTAFHGRLEYDVPGFALGGSMVLNTPAAIVGMGGKVLATADANEEMAFSGIGKRFGRGGSGGTEGHGHDIYMDSRLVGRLTGARQGADATIRGYARRRR